MQSVEHFVTLFDNNFLPMGLCLHRSLLEQGDPFHLWILCIDELVEQHLRKLAIPHVTLIPLRDVEDSRLLAVKSYRSRGEYCWTLTSFTPEFVFERNAEIERVTYLDADLFFLDAPRFLIEEFVKSDKHVFITEHSFGSLYDRFVKARRNGRFCVQFMTFRNTAEARKVMHWWQERCLEWCYARVENGKFGDQKYLDQWPVLFEREVHILEQKEKALAPWNIRSFEKRLNGCLSPVFYHFHGLRLIAPHKILLYSGYKIGESANSIYNAYLQCFIQVMMILKKNDIPSACLPLPKGALGKLLIFKRRIMGNGAYALLPEALTPDSGQ